MRLRTVVFWAHLLAGTVAGLVILVMSATGAILALKPQILDYIERDVRVVEPSNMPALSVAQLLAAARAGRPDAQATAIVVDRHPSVSTAIGFGRDATLYVNPHTGAVLGEGSKTAQTFFRRVENWHRWLAVDGAHRAAARSVNDAANLVFLWLAVSGLYIWWPRKWTPQHVKAITAFRRTTSTRARDFNWHNVIGFWCAPVIIVMTATGVVMSYAWANNLLYRATGTRPPQAQASEAGAGARVERRAAASPIDVDRLFARAAEQLPTWSAITLRLPNRPGAPVAFTLTDGRSWNRFARSELALDAMTGAIVRWQPYEGTSRGQKARGWARYGHTGELGGVAAQTLAGLACLGGVVLVWTGVSLTLRRFFGWL